MGGAHATGLALGIQCHGGGDGDSAIWIRQSAIDCLSAEDCNRRQGSIVLF